jgi:hypothetical protein
VKWHTLDPSGVSVLSFRYVCEACRQALGLEADRFCLNRIKRESGGFSRSGTRQRPPLEVVSRHETGKPFLVGSRQVDVYLTTMTGCSCACTENGHDGTVCTGERQFKVGGRPGSGLVDQLAQQLGREPIPELIVSAHQACEALLGYVLARWFGSTDEERALLEVTSLASMRYDDQVRLLRELLQEERPDLMVEPPYSELAANLRKLARYRDSIAHSEPVGGDFFVRIKRQGAQNLEIRTSPEELAGYLDLAAALKSQLWFVPIHLENSRPDSDPRPPT